jgi:hypothetical protein
MANAPEPISQTRWYYWLGERSHGPIPQQRLRALLGAGDLDPGTPVRRKQADEWMPAWAFPQLIRRIKLEGISPEQRQQMVACHRARSESLVAFGMFMVLVLLMGGNVTAYLLGASVHEALLVLWGGLALGFGAFGVYFVLSRKHTLLRLPGPYRQFGLIAAIGLVAILIGLCLLVIWIAAL